MYSRVGLEGTEEPPPNWTEELGKLLLEIEIIGGKEAAIAARKLYSATHELKSGTVGDMMHADKATEAYRQAVQRDLGLNVTALPLPTWMDDID